jgi:hypothetical protein
MNGTKKDSDSGASYEPPMAHNVNPGSGHPWTGLSASSRMATCSAFCQSSKLLQIGFNPHNNKSRPAAEAQGNHLQLDSPEALFHMPR